MQEQNPSPEPSLLAVLMSIEHRLAVLESTMAVLIGQLTAAGIEPDMATMQKILVAKLGVGLHERDK
jgi:hypothetical protein